MNDESAIIESNETVSKSNYHIRQFMHHLIDIIPTVDHKILQRMKLHQTLHYDHYISKNGCVSNFDGGCTEENMKHHVTNPSKRTQHRQKSLPFQTAQRYTENLIVDIGHNIAVESKQYETTLFGSSKDYFHNIGKDNFYIEMDNHNDNNITNESMIAKGFDTYTIESSFYENEDGDNIPVTSMYKHNYKHKQKIAYKDKDQLFYTKDFCKELITLMTNMGVFSDNEQDISLV